MEGGHHQDGAGHVGQQVAPQQPEVTHPHRPGGQDVGLAGDGAGGAADDAHDAGQPRQPRRQGDVAHPRPQQGDDAQRQQQVGEGQEQVHPPADQFVQHALVEAGEQPQQDAGQRRQGGCQEPHPSVQRPP